MSYLDFIPDSLMLRLQYYIKTGKHLHLSAPVSFNEKIQHYKLYHRDKGMLRCTDKIEVRNYVKEKGLSHILIPVYSIIEHPYSVDFSSLPDKFVAKTSDGGGGNQVLICKDKTQFAAKDFDSFIKDCRNLPKGKRHFAREWAYENGLPRKIIIEKLLEDDQGKDASDFKFMCFGGKFKCLWVDTERFGNHKRSFWDENLCRINEARCLYPPIEDGFVLPENIRKMIDIAERLAEGFPFARIDLYNIEGKIYFGEITFYPNSGYELFAPQSFDRLLGSFFPSF